MLKLLLDVCFIPAQAVQFLDDECVSAAEKLMLQIAITFTIGVLSRGFIHYDTLLGHAKPDKCFQLTVGILLPCGYAGITIDSIVHMTPFRAKMSL